MTIKWNFCCYVWTKFFFYEFRYKLVKLFEVEGTKRYSNVEQLCLNINLFRKRGTSYVSFWMTRFKASKLNYLILRIFKFFKIKFMLVWENWLSMHDVWPKFQLLIYSVLIRNHINWIDMEIKLNCCSYVAFFF